MRPSLSSSFASFSRLSNISSHAGNQLSRIQNGMRDGSLSRGEARGLLSQQRNIASATQQALSDGKISRSEFRNIRDMQRKASGDIFENRHNSCERPGLSDSRSSRVAAGQDNQRKRIVDGLNDGSLSSREASSLLAQQGRIADAKTSAMADGKMDASEFRNIRQLQQMASQSIFAARHNCIRG